MPRSAGFPDAVYPLHRAAPMGFTGSASWAQAFNEVVAEEAHLPQDRRLVDGTIPPASLPAWGSVLGGFWSLEERPSGGAGWGEPLMSRVGSEWTGHGLATNV